MRKNEERTLKAELQLCPEQNHIGEHQREDRTMTFHSASAQDDRMLAALRTAPVTSLEASGDLDIVHPPSSVRRLRRRGYDIRTEWVYQATEPGRPPHRVGRYVLIAEPARIAA